MGTKYSITIYLNYMGTSDPYKVAVRVGESTYAKSK